MLGARCDGCGRSGIGALLVRSSFSLGLENIRFVVVPYSTLSCTDYIGRGDSVTKHDKSIYLNLHLREYIDKNN